jgi:hypothetical protein
MKTPSRVRGRGRGQTRAAPAAKTTTTARRTAAKAAKARAAENKRAQKRDAREAQRASDKAMIAADEAMIAANITSTIFRCNAAECFTRRCQKCTRVRKNTLQRIQRLEEPLTEEGRQRIHARRQRTADRKLRTQTMPHCTKTALCTLDDFDEAIVETHYCGKYDQICEFCGALYWQAEACADGIYSRCCRRGKVVLDAVPDPPPELMRLYTSSSTDAVAFREHIRPYNNSLNMCSMKVNDETFQRRNRDGTSYQCPVASLRISGQMHHYIGTLKQRDGDEPKGTQVYLLDPLDQVTHRCRTAALDRETLSTLTNMMHCHNVLACEFKMASEKIERGTTLDARIVIHAEERNAGVHARQGNAQMCNELAIIMEGNEESNFVASRDIVMEYRNTNDPHGPNRHGVTGVSGLHRLRDPLHYPLFFPHGTTHGWHIGLQDTDGNSITEMDYYAYRLHERALHGSRDFSALHRGGRLLQEYILDAHCKIEASRLNWQRFHQKELRAECYSGLLDALRNNDAANAGSHIILAPSFIGGPREMHAAFQDSMAIVRTHGKPHLFITMTCNPHWQEITENLLPGQQPQDRPDLVVRVFRIKLAALIADLYEHGICGTTMAYTGTLEYQKRGLPHAHILIILKQAPSLEHIDMFVSAEIPNPSTQPELYKIIISQMIHGPCGEMKPSAPCMSEGECEKGFPKEFCDETTVPVDAFAQYRRRSPLSGGHTFNKTTKDTDGGVIQITIDNRSTVPYNPFLSKKYNCHINVEVCTSVRSVKYIHKYVFKGPDYATISIEENRDQPRYAANIDEIAEYHNGRYVCATESINRLLGGEVHFRVPPVQTLAVHLENMQRAYWEESNDLTVLQARATLAAAAPPKTTLTAWFELNQKHDRRARVAGCGLGPGPWLKRGEVDARTLLYRDLPTHFVFTTDKTWERRKQGETRRRVRDGLDVYDYSSDKLGRTINVAPDQGEVYYFRTLLNYVKGPLQYSDIRKYEGTLHDTFIGACRARGLLQDDDEWRACLDEAKLTQSATQLRALFSTILTSCAPSDPRALWEQFKLDICEDILHRHRRFFRNMNLTLNGDMENEALLDIEVHIDAAGKTMEDMHLPTPEPMQQMTCRMVADELEISSTIEKRTALAAEAQRLENMMRQNNQTQHTVFSEIMADIHAPRGSCTFIDAPAGTGKTTLSNAILASVRKNGEIALATATSGIAATLMPLGRTAHSRYKLPLKPTPRSMCGFTKAVRNETRAVLAAAKVLIWDEATMAHRHLPESLDRTLRFVMDRDEPFGGLVIVFLGDFRQVLPVVKKGRRHQIVDASFKHSPLWKQIRVRNLTTNMRVMMSTGENQAELAQFANFVLRIGDGREPAVEGLGTDFIKMPDSMCLTDPTVTNLIDNVYTDMTTKWRDVAWLSERAILTPKNDDVDMLNDAITSRFNPKAPEHELLSADCVGPEDDPLLYPSEFLNAQNVSGLPPHTLRLKLGMVVILLRNLRPAKSHCNGSRYIVRSISRRLLELESVINGSRLLVPRILLTTDDDFTFVLHRRQFPIRSAFAMTINKAQGQTLARVGVFLPVPVFTHGQLYVAVSRVRKRHDIVFCITPTTASRVVAQERPGHYTQNIVYREVLSK